MKRLSRSSGKVYGNLKDTLKRQIELGELEQGEAIMAERRLAALFSISRESVRRGLRELAEEGYLKVVPAKGVFVDYRGTRQRSGTGTSTLGYVFWGTRDSVIHAPFFEGQIRGVEQEAQNRGYHLMVAAQQRSELDHLPPMVLDKKVDGVLLEGAPLATYRQIEESVPVVFIGDFNRGQSRTEERSGDMVAIDNLRTTMNLFSDLYELGHRKIAFVSPPLNHSAFYERFEGYQLSLYKHGISLSEDYVLFTPRTPTLESVEPILSIPDRPTAIVAGNDVTALHILAAAERAGLSVPTQLSVTGFDDLDSAGLSKPALTTVRVPTGEMGRLAVRRLIEKLETSDRDEILTLIPGDIIHRESCAPPPTNGRP